MQTISTFRENQKLNFRRAMSIGITTIIDTDVHLNEGLRDKVDFGCEREITD